MEPGSQIGIWSRGMLPQWYVVHSLPQAEARVAALLSAERNSWRMQTYLPLLPARHQGTRRAAAKPLFPGYLFLRCDPERLNLPELRRVPGFGSLVSFGDHLAVIEDDTIEALQARLGTLWESGEPYEWYRSGETLRVSSGPLCGLTAIFEGPLQPSERVRVLVEFLGRSSRMSIPVGILEREHAGGRRTRGRGRFIKPRSTHSQD